MIGWAMALAWEIKTGERIDGDLIHVESHDPATPTIAQRTDAVVKAKQSGILSREGAWDELGWPEERKKRERSYFAAELNDPTIQLANSLLNGSTDAALGNA